MDNTHFRVQLFTVANHSFGIAMPANGSLWQDLFPAYHSFENSSARQLLFTLTVADEIDPMGDIRLIVKDTNPKPEEVKLDMYHTVNGRLFEMRFPFTDRVNCRLHISNDFHTAQVSLSGSEYEQLHGLNSALMLCYLLATARLDTVLMHASTVVNDGKAYLFLGRSGTGKSTHSRLWLQAIPGTKLLNDDHPIIRIDEAGEVIAYGSPWSGKTPCYHNESAPIGGIVRIKQAPANSIRLLSPIEAYASLFTSSSGMIWEKELADAKDRTLQKIVSRIAIRTLNCLPDEAAARLCAEAVRKGEQCNG